MGEKFPPKQCHYDRILLPMTELLAPNAQIHGHSEGTVKLAKAHCDSTYCPRKLIFDNLGNYKITLFYFQTEIKKCVPKCSKRRSEVRMQILFC